MGKSGGVTTGKKKKGRPSLADLKRRAELEEEQQQLQNQNRKSTRRNPNSAAEDVSNDEEEYYDDDDDEREEKKVKLVVRLPQLDQQSDLIRSSPVNSVSCGSDSNADADNRKINSGSGGIVPNSQVEKIVKAMDTSHGSPLEAGPTTNTPLPDKKLLVFILDRLQKKDTHAVFSEPVDPDELPDYHEIVEQPMDFGTLRSKLDEGRYSNLEELEADVYLICSNAMQYNPSDTVFFRQARSIQELAKRDFENLRQEGDDGELQPKVVKRGRPPSKHLKKPPGRTSVEVVAVAPESTSGPTVEKVIDTTNDNTPYNLRRGPAMYKNYADGVFSSNRNRNGDGHSELLTDWNEEFPARIKRADLKYGNKNFVIDESRRDTYKQFHPLNFANRNTLLTNFGGERKQLLAVGLHAEHGFSRSLARFAAHMGPVVWKVASKKIEKSLPPGVKFAPGVVGPPDSSSPPTSFFPPGKMNYTPNLPRDDILTKPEITTSTSGPKVEEHSGIIKTNEPQPQYGRNGFKMGMFHANGRQPNHGTIVDAQCTKGETGNPAKPSWQQGPSVGRKICSVGSPQQPDLALQL